MFGITCQELFDKYNITGSLGSGSTCVVLEASDRALGRPCAIKVFDKQETATNIERINEEINVLSRLDHPNIINMYETIKSEDNSSSSSSGCSVFMVFEKVDKSDLFDLIQQNEGFPDDHARLIMKQLVEAVCYMHQKNVVHRDIKPENILILTQNGKQTIKLGDFGFAHLLSHPNEKMNRLVGTYEYFSPEQILRKPYTKSVDMWAVGVTTFAVLCGRCLFYDDDDQKSREKTINGDTSLVDCLGDVVSDCTKDFIKKLVAVDPEKRMTAEQARDHPWLTSSSLVTPARPKVLSPLIVRTKAKFFNVSGGASGNNRGNTIDNENRCDSTTNTEGCSEAASKGVVVESPINSPLHSVKSVITPMKEVSLNDLQNVKKTLF